MCQPGIKWADIGRLASGSDMMPSLMGPGGLLNTIWVLNYQLKVGGNDGIFTGAYKIGVARRQLMKGEENGSYGGRRGP